MSTSSKLCKDVPSTVESKGASTDVASRSADNNTVQKATYNAAVVLSKKISDCYNPGKVKSILKKCFCSSDEVNGSPSDS